IIRGPGYVNLDLGPIKFIPLGKEMRLQFRTEFFNLTSTPHFANPVVRMSDPAFGPDHAHAQPDQLRIGGNVLREPDDPVRSEVGILSLSGWRMQRGAPE